jgi:hypothetical protein
MAAGLTFAIEVEVDEGDLAETLSRYPCLLVVPTDSGLALQGTFPILLEEREIDAFRVRIELYRGATGVTAALREIGGRIPQTAERHIFGLQGYACVALPEDVYLRTGGKPLSLVSFLDGPVRSFLLAQLVMERGGHWPFGDRAHGVDGLADFYAELIGTRDLRTVARYLEVLTHARTYRQWLCPCGSGAKLRRCHADQLAALRARLLPHVAARFLDRVRLVLAPPAKRAP